MYVCMFTAYVDIHTYVHTYIPTYIHTYTHTYIHTYIHTCIYIYIYIYMYIHMHMYMYMYMYMYKTADSQPNLSLWDIADQLVSRSEKSPIQSPIHLFQALRLCRTMCVKLWEIADPLVSESQPNQLHHSLKEIDDLLISSSDQSRTTVTSQPNHSHIIATSQSQPNHSHITESKIFADPLVS